MEIPEKELENIIVNTDRKKLHERGLCFIPPEEETNVKVMRQTYLSDAGRSDVIMAHRVYSEARNRTVLVINVIELKKDKLSIDTVSQVLKYVYAIFIYLTEERGLEEESFEINPIIIGQRVMDDLGFVPQILNIDSNTGTINRFGVFTFRYDIDGLVFKEATFNYVLVKNNDYDDSELPF